MGLEGRRQDSRWRSTAKITRDGAPPRVNCDGLTSILSSRLAPLSIAAADARVGPVSDCGLGTLPIPIRMQA
jgi:hypothetical protein